MIFGAPLQVLADSSSAYSKEPESTDSLPRYPLFDQTVTLDGKVGHYIALARRKGDTCYAGALGT